MDYNTLTTLLSAILPTDGDVFLMTKNPKTQRFLHQRFKAVDLTSDVLKATIELANSEKKCSYITMSSYEFSPTRFRAETLFKLGRGFFIDVDCDGTRDFNEILTDFKQMTQLEPYVAINSGHGLHLAILVEDFLDRESFKSINTTLQQALVNLKINGAKIDAQPITANIRIPNSLNCKNIDTPKCVYILDQTDKVYVTSQFVSHLTELKTKLHPLATMSGVDYTPTINAQDSPPILQNIDGNIFGKITGLLASDAINSCKQLQQQASANEFAWVSMINTLLPLDGAYQHIHDLSSKHRDYNKDLTDSKILSQINIGASPRKCTTFENNRANLCLQCEFYGLKNAEGSAISPIYFAHREAGLRKEREMLPTKPPKDAILLEEGAEELAVFTHDRFVIDTNPNSTTFGVSALENVKVAKKIEVVEELLYSFVPIKGIQLITDMVKGVRPIVFQITFEDRRKKKYVVELPAGDCSGTKYVEYLNAIGITYQSGKRQLCMNFLEALVNHYRETTTPIEATEKLGFDLNRSTFTLGNKVYTKCGVQTVEPRGSIAQYMIDTSPMGEDSTLGLWKKAAALYQENGMEWCQAIIAASVAAPLITFLELGGSCAVSLFGESGNGKSTVQRLCTAIWGHPQKLLATGNDTELAGFLKMGHLNSIPLHFDEMTMVSVKKLGNFAYQTTQGRPKDASTDKGVLRANPYRFSSLVTLSTNKSIQNALMNDRDSNAAQRRRIVELMTTPIVGVAKYSNTEVNAIIGELNGNSGWVGHFLAKKFMDNIDYYKKRIQDISINIDKEAKKYGYTSADRFLTPFLSLAIIGCEIGSAYKLFDYDIERVTNYVRSAITRISQSISEAERLADEGVEIREYLVEYSDYCLMVNAPTFEIYKTIAAVQSDTPNHATDSVYIHSSSPKTKVLIRSARKVRGKDDLVSNKFIHTIDAKSFKDFCTKHGYDLHAVLNSFRKKGGSAIFIKEDLLAGTSRSTGVLGDCIQIDFSD